MPRPPRQTGRAKRSHSALLRLLRPVREVRKSCLIDSSSGLRRSPMSGIVLAMYVHLLLRPWVKAA